MSGIAGIIRTDGRPIERGLIEIMTRAMSHRGPDGIRHFVRGNVALGHCMLHTTPESLEEIQPLANEDGSVILIMDGRVDNWEGLRTKLLQHGVRLRSRTDAELVLRSYETWGEDCLAHIDGDFAFAIWNERKREVYSARDRLGNKPFHYFRSENVFAFATDVNALLALPFIPREANEDLVAEFIASEFYSIDETFWKNVYRLPQARTLRIFGNGHEIVRYWQPSLDKVIRYKTEKDYADHLRSLLFDCVRAASRTHAKLACEVSGGLDSSSNFCVAHALWRAGRLLAPDLQGFTLAFEGDPRADERKYARAVAHHLDVAVQEVKPTFPSRSWFSETARRELDFPGYPNLEASIDMHRSMSAQGCSVVIDGEGGDEWLGGDRYYYFDALRSREFGTLARSFMADSRACGLGQAMRYFITGGLFPFLPFPLEAAIYSARRRIAGAHLEQDFWLSAQMRDRIERRRSAFPPRSWRVNPTRQMLMEKLEYAFAAWVTELRERHCARHGLEPRSPLRNYRMIEFSFATPSWVKLRGKKNKQLLRLALQESLPKEISERTDKSELSLTFRVQLQEMRDYFLGCRSSELHKWACPNGMRKLYEELETRTGGRPLWPLWGIYGCGCLLHGTGHETIQRE